MNKKVIFTTVCIFIFFYILNYLTPMAFGDDYVYSFVWQGHSEYEPLTETATRVSSLQDLLISQWSHYFTWSGRAVSHIIAQFFLWVGKPVFNIFNAFISVLLIIEIYWCANKGIVTFDFKMSRLLYIFFALWAFTPAFSSVFLWLTGACNYLWTVVLLLGFLLPFVHKFYFFEKNISHHKRFTFSMFFFGMLAGWTTENSICWIILVLLVFFYVNREKIEIESWMISGLAGLIVGYTLLMFAPGNVVRLQAETGASSGWVTGRLISAHLNMLAVVFLFQLLLWYFNLRSLFILKIEAKKKAVVKWDKLLVQTLCVLSFCMTAMMLFSPNFPPRSSFPGTVLLVIVSSVLLRAQEEYKINLILKNAKRFLCIVGTICFLISATASLYGFYDYHMQIKDILSFLKCSERTKSEIVEVPPLKPVNGTIGNMSGFRLLYYRMSDNEKDWRNVAFSRYHGIKGIRMIKSKSVDQE